MRNLGRYTVFKFLGTLTGDNIKEYWGNNLIIGWECGS